MLAPLLRHKAWIKCRQAAKHSQALFTLLKVNTRQVEVFLFIPCRFYDLAIYAYSIIDTPELRIDHSQVDPGSREIRLQPPGLHVCFRRILESRKLLAIMKDLQVTATIFGVGDWMKDNPAIVASMVDDGHEMGNHTWSHQPMRTLSSQRLLDEITGCADVLTQLVGSPTRWFRPSGLEVPTEAILKQAGTAGYQVSVGYDVDSLDFQDPAVTDIITNVTDIVAGGSIISLHFGHEGTLKALPKIVEHIRGLGLTPGTVGQLLG